MQKLVLFDIDHTLVIGGKAHGEAFLLAIKQVYGVDVKHTGNYAGMTDQQIIFLLLQTQGISLDIIQAKINECIKYISQFYTDLIVNDKVIVLPGVRELLVELTKQRVLLGLVTGNLKLVAEAKLKKVGLWDYFKVGGFGSDAVDRAELIKLAIERAGVRFNFVKNGNVFYIGDAEGDVAAGKKVGLKMMGVATSIFSQEQLMAAGADYVLPDLVNIEKVLNILF